MHLGRVGSESGIPPFRGKLEAEREPESHTCCGVSPGVDATSNVYWLWRGNTYEPQFSHLYIGVITATSWESHDEQENKGLALCPAVVVSMAAVAVSAQTWPAGAGNLPSFPCRQLQFGFR